MIITTTDQVDGRMIAEYLGLVSVVVLAQFPGGSKWMNSALEKQMAEANEQLNEKAAAIGADAIVGLRHSGIGANHVFIGAAVRFK